MNSSDGVEVPETNPCNACGSVNTSSQIATTKAGIHCCCSDCGAMGKGAETLFEAIDSWNKRVVTSSPEQEEGVTK